MTIECIFNVYSMDFIYEKMWVLKLLMTHVELVLGLRFPMVVRIVLAL